jgi:hypothetical protein
MKLADKQAALIDAIANTIPDDFGAQELIKHAKESPPLAVALHALAPRPGVQKVGKLLAKMRGKTYGQHTLDAYEDLHKKTWRYCVIAAKLSRPQMILDDAKSELEIAQAFAEADPLCKLSDEQLANTFRNKTTERTAERIQREHDARVARAQRALDRIVIAKDPEALEVLKRNKEQRAAFRKVGANPMNPHMTTEHEEYMASLPPQQAEPAEPWTNPNIPTHRARETPEGFDDPMGFVSANMRAERSRSRGADSPWDHDSNCMLDTGMASNYFGDAKFVPTMDPEYYP